MNAALTMLAFGALLFTRQDIEGLQIGTVHSLTGTVTCNFRHGDIDGDGAQDLVFADGVCFQRGGMFPEYARRAYPKRGQTYQVDTWGGLVCLRDDNEIVFLCLKDENWVDNRFPVYGRDRTIAAGVDEKAGSNEHQEGKRTRLAGFLYDLDGDGTPEIVDLDPEGVVVYTRQDGEQGAYHFNAILKAYPQLRLEYESRKPVWPLETRILEYPALSSMFRIWVETGSLQVLTREDLDTGEVIYHGTRYKVKRGTEFMLDTEQKETWRTEPLPGYMQPCRLNPDDIMDFGGGVWQWDRNKAFSIPIHETGATTDLGRTMFMTRSPGFRPNAMFIDVDGDGLLDLLTESTGLFEGGLREGLTQFTTQRFLHHRLTAYRQRTDGVFDRTPFIRGRFETELDSPPVRGGVMFQRYQAAELFCLAGDYNGDGHRDALIQASPARLEVYENRESGFQNKPSATLEVEPDWRFTVMDLNADGRTDVVCHWVDSTNGKARALVYFSEGHNP